MSRTDDLHIAAAMTGIVPCRERARCNGCAIDGNRAEHRRTDLFRRYERERREGNIAYPGPSAWAHRDELVALSASKLGIVPLLVGPERRGSLITAARNRDRWSHLWFMAQTGRILMGWDD